MEMDPPQAQNKQACFVNTGKGPIRAFGKRGSQGAGVIGKQGIGVNTPMAAAVATATIGLAKERQKPKGIMLTSGRWSITEAIGIPWRKIRHAGNTFKTLGETPKEHCKRAPALTTSAILRLVIQEYTPIIRDQSWRNPFWISVYKPRIQLYFSGRSGFSLEKGTGAPYHIGPRPFQYGFFIRPALDWIQGSHG